MSLGNVVRVAVVLAACVAAAGSASSSSNENASAMSPHQGANSPPPPQQMEPGRALGVWRSTFGAVRIEADNTKGGIQTGAVQGVWVYQRQGQEVIGYFSGSLRGNVLQFRWQEPNDPPLTGEGFLVFDPQGRQYAGRWWSDRRDRVGAWNGWRHGGTDGQRQQPNPGPYGGDGQVDPYAGQYGGQPYGNQPPPPQPYRQPDLQPAPQPPPPRSYY